jgi:hypothetical protein
MFAKVAFIGFFHPLHGAVSQVSGFRCQGSAVIAKEGSAIPIPDP